MQLCLLKIKVAADNSLLGEYVLSLWKPKN